MTYLSDIIRTEQLFDLKNPSIILCNHELEEVLNMKALHVTEIRLASQQQQQQQQQLYFRPLVLDQLEELPSVPLAPPERVRRRRMAGQYPLTPPPPINKEAKFRLSPKLLSVVRSLPTTNQDQTVFSYGEVLLLLIITLSLSLSLDHETALRLHS